MSRLDTSIRPYLFFPDGKTARELSPEVAKKVGPEGYKRYEYVLYTMAQLSRIVYCDAAIGRLVLEKTLGLSPDLVNQAISDYDYKFKSQRRVPVKEGVAVSGAPPGTKEYPMESYILTPHTNQVAAQFGTYISTPEDFTAIVMDTTQFKPNKYAPWKTNDVILVIKGSSTMQNFKHDLMSQFTPAPLETNFQKLGFSNEKTGLIVPQSFVTPIVNAWAVLKKALAEQVKGEGTRLFITGHSLGGAYASLLTFILALAKTGSKRDPSLAFLDKIQIIHNVTYGAPTIVSDKARNAFNEFLKSGLITLDRVVSQKLPSRSVGAGVTVVGPNDVIPLIPAGFSHPGYRPLVTNIKPEAGGRPYSMEFVRKFFGVQTENRWRDAATWPFQEPLSMTAEAIKARVKELTGVETAPESEGKENESALKGELGSTTVSGGEEDPQAGGAFLNTLKTAVGKATSLVPGLGQEKQAYSKNTQGMIPNFLSIAPSIAGLAFAHAEYLGMTFFGAFRLPGMKNPSKMYPAFFGLYKDGVKAMYVKLVNGIEPSSSSENPQPLTGGRRLARKSVTSRKHRKTTRKGRKGTRKY